MAVPNPRGWLGEYAWVWDAICWVSAGEAWPTGDEDKMRELADAWQGLADAVSEALFEADPAVMKILQSWGGGAGEAFGTLWNQLGVDPNSGLPLISEVAAAYAAGCDQAALEIEYAKLTVLIAVMITVIAVFVALLMAWLGGVSATAIPGILAAGRQAVTIAFRRLIAQMGRQMLTRAGVQAALRTAGTRLGQIVTSQGFRQGMTRLGLELLEEIGEELIIDVGAQAYQMHTGERRQWDGKRTLTAGVGGAYGAVLGTGMNWAGRRAAPRMPVSFSPSRLSFPGSGVVRWGSSSLASGAQNAIISPAASVLANGTVNGQWALPDANAFLGGFASGAGRTGATIIGTNVGIQAANLTNWALGRNPNLTPGAGLDVGGIDPSLAVGGTNGLGNLGGTNGAPGGTGAGSTSGAGSTGGGTGSTSGGGPGTGAGSTSGASAGAGAGGSGSDGTGSTSVSGGSSGAVNIDTGGPVQNGAGTVPDSGSGSISLAPPSIDAAAPTTDAAAPATDPSAAPVVDGGTTASDPTTTAGGTPNHSIVAAESTVDVAQNSPPDGQAASERPATPAPESPGGDRPASDSTDQTDGGQVAGPRTDIVATPSGDGSTGPARALVDTPTADLAAPGPVDIQADPSVSDAPPAVLPGTPPSAPVVAPPPGNVTPAGAAAPTHPAPAAGPPAGPPTGPQVATAPNAPAPGTNAAPPTGQQPGNTTGQPAPGRTTPSGPIVNPAAANSAGSISLTPAAGPTSTGPNPSGAPQQATPQQGTPAGQGTASQPGNPPSPGRPEAQTPVVPPAPTVPVQTTGTDPTATPGLTGPVAQDGAFDPAADRTDQAQRPTAEGPVVVPVPGATAALHGGPTGPGTDVGPVNPETLRRSEGPTGRGTHSWQLDPTAVEGDPTGPDAERTLIEASRTLAETVRTAVKDATVSKGKQPGMAGALLMPNGEITTHTSMTADKSTRPPTQPRVHPLAQAALDRTAADLVDGVGGGHGKCAEVALISDQLYKLEQQWREAGEPGNFEQYALDALQGAKIVTHQAKRALSDGVAYDPGNYRPPCRSCAHFLPQFNVEPITDPDRDVGAYQPPVPGVVGNGPPLSDSRPYGQPEGLVPPDQADQDALVAAVPQDPTTGRPLVHPDPRAPWTGLINDGGPTVPGRATNCADVGLSVLSTWFGRPEVAAPTAPSTQVEAGSTARQEQALRSSFAHSGSGTTALDSVAQALRAAGPGSAALIVNTWADGPGAHTWNAVNHDGTIVWLDGQNQLISDTDPLHAPQVGDVWAIVLDAEGDPVRPAQTDGHPPAPAPPASTRGPDDGPAGLARDGTDGLTDPDGPDLRQAAAGTTFGGALLDADPARTAAAVQAALTSGPLPGAASVDPHTGTVTLDTADGPYRVRIELTNPPADTPVVPVATVQHTDDGAVVQVSTGAHPDHVRRAVAATLAEADTVAQERALGLRVDATTALAEGARPEYDGSRVLTARDMGHLAELRVVLAESSSVADPARAGQLQAEALSLLVASGLLEQDPTHAVHGLGGNVPVVGPEAAQARLDLIRTHLAPVAPHVEALIGLAQAEGRQLVADIRSAQSAIRAEARAWAQQATALRDDADLALTNRVDAALDAAPDHVFGRLVIGGGWAATADFVTMGAAGDTGTGLPPVLCVSQGHDPWAERQTLLMGQIPSELELPGLPFQPADLAAEGTQFTPSDVFADAVGAARALSGMPTYQGTATAITPRPADAAGWPDGANYRVTVGGREFFTASVDIATGPGPSRVPSAPATTNGQYVDPTTGYRVDRSGPTPTFRDPDGNPVAPDQLPPQVRAVLGGPGTDLPLLTDLAGRPTDPLVVDPVSGHAVDPSTGQVFDPDGGQVDPGTLADEIRTRLGYAPDGTFSDPRPSIPPVNFGGQNLADAYRPGDRVLVYGAGASGAWDIEQAAASAAGRVDWSAREMDPPADQLTGDPARDAEARLRYSFGGGYNRRNTLPDVGAYSEAVQSRAEQSLREIVSLRHTVDGGFLVEFTDGSRQEYDRVVLSIGQAAEYPGGVADLLSGTDLDLLTGPRAVDGTEFDVLGLQDGTGHLRVLGAASVAGPVVALTPDPQQTRWLQTRQAAALPDDSRGIAPSIRFQAQRIAEANRGLPPVPPTPAGVGPAPVTAPSDLVPESDAGSPAPPEVEPGQRTVPLDQVPAQRGQLDPHGLAVDVLPEALGGDRDPVAPQVDVAQGGQVPAGGEGLGSGRADPAVGQAQPAQPAQVRGGDQIGETVVTDRVPAQVQGDQATQDGDAGDVLDPAVGVDQLQVADGQVGPDLVAVVDEGAGGHRRHLDEAVARLPVDEQVGDRRGEPRVDPSAQEHGLPGGTDTGQVEADQLGVLGVGGLDRVGVPASQLKVVGVGQDGGVDLGGRGHDGSVSIRRLAAAYADADPAGRLALRAEIDALAEHLGLRVGDPDARARWALLPPDALANLMQLTVPALTPDAVSAVLAGAPTLTEVERIRMIDYRARLAPDFQVPQQPDLDARLRELTVEAEHSQSGMPRMPAFAGQIVGVPPAQLDRIRAVDPQLADRLAREGVYVDLTGRYDLRPYMVASVPAIDLGAARPAFDLSTEAGRQAQLHEDRQRSRAALRGLHGDQAATALLADHDFHYQGTARWMGLVPDVLTEVLRSITPAPPSPTVTAESATTLEPSRETRATADRVTLPPDTPNRPGPVYGPALDARTGQPPPLFDGPPKRADVQQGALGDCGMIAVIGSVAGHLPNTIAQMFQPNPDGSVDVLLHESSGPGQSITPTGRQLRITVWPDVPLHPNSAGRSAYADQSSVGTAWASLLEKAIAAVDRTWTQQRHDQWQQQWTARPDVDVAQAAPLGYARLGNGSTRPVQAELLTQLTGLPTAVSQLDPTPGREADAEARLAALLAAGSPVITGTQPARAYGAYPGGKPPYGLVPGHAYEIVSVADGEVQLRNPWNSSHPTPMPIRAFLDLMSPWYAHVELARSTVAALPDSEFHGQGRPAADPTAVLDRARVLLPTLAEPIGADQVVAVGPDIVEIRAAGLEPLRIRLAAGTLTAGTVAQTTRNLDGTFTLTVSDRAADGVVDRAVAHEAAELLARHETGNAQAGLFDQGTADQPIDPGGLSARDRGRLAELRLLAAGYAQADPTARLALRAEIDTLVDRLGLRWGTPDAAARLAVLPVDVRHQVMQLSLPVITPEAVATVLAFHPNQTAVERFRTIDYRSRLAPDFQPPPAATLNAKLRELAVHGEQSQSSLPRMPALAGQVIGLPPNLLDSIRQVDPQLADRVAAEGVYVDLAGRFDLRPYTLDGAPEITLEASQPAYDLNTEAGRRALLAEDRARVTATFRAAYGTHPGAMAVLTTHDFHYLTDARRMALVPTALTDALRAMMPPAPDVEVEATPDVTSGEVAVVADRVTLPDPDASHPVGYGPALDARSGQPAPLFAGPPRREQVQQGMLGDCGMLATMAAVAGYQPDALARLFQPNPDGTVDVLLHESVLRGGTSTAPTGRRLRITVRPDVPLFTAAAGRSAYADQSFNGSGWAAVLEKALAAVDRTWTVERREAWQRNWAAWHSKGDPHRAAPAGYARLDVGSTTQMQAELLTQLTGAPSRTAFLDTRPGQEAAEAARLAALIAAGGPVIAGTKANEDYPPAIRQQLPFGLYPGHAYEVVSVTDGMVQLRNPWNREHPAPMPIQDFLKLMAGDYAHLDIAPAAPAPQTVPPAQPPSDAAKADLPATADPVRPSRHSLGRTDVDDERPGVGYYALLGAAGTVTGLMVVVSSGPGRRSAHWTTGGEPAAGGSVPVGRAEAERIAREVLGFALPEEPALHDMVDG